MGGGGSKSDDKKNNAPQDKPRSGANNEATTTSTNSPPSDPMPATTAPNPVPTVAETESSFHIVILGAGGVGKSTIVKQLAMSMGSGIDKEHRLEAAMMLRLCIINKTIHVTERALAGVEGVPELSDSVLDNVDVVQQCDVKKLSGNELEQVGMALNVIWSNDVVKKIDSIPLAQGALSISEELLHQCAE